jgi:hypothetical protein
MSAAVDACFSSLLILGILAKVVEETLGAFARQARKHGSV